MEDDLKENIFSGVSVEYEVSILVLMEDDLKEAISYLGADGMPVFQSLF